MVKKFKKLNRVLDLSFGLAVPKKALIIYCNCCRDLSKSQNFATFLGVRCDELLTHEVRGVLHEFKDASHLVKEVALQDIKDKVLGENIERVILGVFQDCKNDKLPPKKQTPEEALIGFVNRVIRVEIFMQDIFLKYPVDKQPILSVYPITLFRGKLILNEMTFELSEEKVVSKETPRFEIKHKPRKS